MSEEQPVFKVTDRRLFNPDGTPRDIERTEDAPAATAAGRSEDASAAPAAAESAATAAPSSETERPGSVAPAAASASPATVEQSGRPSEEAAAAESARPDDLPEDEYGGEEIPGAEDPASFINFLMSIASNAAASLGMMEHPATGQRSVDLQLAKHWIDVLGMLQEKTRGNISAQERQIFEGLLTDLRMQYVSLTSAPQPKSPRGLTGRDIIGGR
ncbi:MAG TPA: DUF1844 domain-containing protein [Pyrinomonadaceae bacterium]|jgi:hypothetical protein